MATIKTYSEYGSDKAIADKAAAVAEAFQAEIAAVMAKYKASVSVREDSRGYSTYVEGIDVDFEGIYDENFDMVRPFFTIQFGTDMS